MARQQHYPADGAPDQTAGARISARISLPAPANDNSSSSVMRTVVVVLASAIAFATALLALQPFG